eukprot:Tbor_TRINITY_DN2303_c0_g1::TRINITY_DN2303_c0_g1_i1::g.180::m.180
MECKDSRSAACIGMKCKEIFDLRNKEFSRLDRNGHIYLDYTGGMLYPESLVKAHADQMMNGVYGNPHSNNPTSLVSTALVDKARNDVLKFFNASPSDYICIFTSNASGALKTVGESFPFSEGGQFLLLVDNHNSVNGIREFARARGSKVSYVKTTRSLRIDDDILESLLNVQTSQPEEPKLFAFPAQSNFSGVKHSLDWISRAQAHGWSVLLDAAAYVPTSQLDLSVHKPEFVTLSFYKIFGYPTGIGALLMKREISPKMLRPWFAGGTIKYVSTTDETHVLASDHEAFEDGTVNYLGLPAVSLGLRFMSSIGMNKITMHVTSLTHDIITGLNKIKHSNGSSVVSILGPSTTYLRGGTVTIDVFDKNHVIFQPATVEMLANQYNISIRSGCFCNPGDSEMLFPEAWKVMRQLVSNSPGTDPKTAKDQGVEIAAAVRISVGIPTSVKDINALLSFIEDTFKDKLSTDYDPICNTKGKCHFSDIKKNKILKSSL